MILNAEKQKKICGISTTWPAKVRQKRSKTHSPRRPLWRLGAPVGRPVGFVVRFRIALAGHVVEVPRNVWSLFRGRSLFPWTL